MDIKWSFYLIGVIYILVSVLKIMNSMRVVRFKKENSDSIKFMAIKKDFFTTVSIICIFVTLFINGAALKGGKPINTASIIITLLVLGFTCLNSILSIYLSTENSTILLLGYELKQGEIESFKIKERKIYTAYDITFTKEIDSYNYAKLWIFGSGKEQFKNAVEKLKKDEK